MNVLREAEQAVEGSRQNDYGSPLVNHSRTAALWSVLFGIDVTPEQVCWANILQKAARCINANTRDSLVDVAGYALNLEMVTRERSRHALPLQLIDSEAVLIDALWDGTDTDMREERTRAAAKRIRDRVAAFAAAWEQDG